MSYLIKTLVVVVALALVVCEAQVNFSPGWGTGKRSGIQEGPCKGSTESIMYIYKLVQVGRVLKLFLLLYMKFY
ncbi:Hypertrehalosaemic prohormone [Blattella germanica]|nr:Hypertrehalosaemic prohormone [Blattella germanica]